jgi:hypothetical protein
MVVSTELERRAQRYAKARSLQELDYTNPDLDHARTEAHDVFMMQLDIEGIPYKDREHAAEIALAIVNGEEEKLQEPEVPVVA